MTVKRKDFQKTAAYIHQFLLKLDEGQESAEVRDALNLALLHMQKFFRWLQRRIEGQENGGTLSHSSLRGLSPMTPFNDHPDRFMWKWIDLENQKHLSMTMALAKEQGISSTIGLIHTASKTGEVNTVLQLYEKDNSCINYCDGLGRSPLMYAVHYEQLAVFELLLRCKADINAVANDQSTVLHIACYEGKWRFVDLLVQYKANINVQDMLGRAPIHWAVCTATTESLKILLKNGANARIQDCDNVTPSMYACRLDNIDHYIILDKAMAHITNEYSDGFERDRFGQTSLHWSVRRTAPLECLKTMISEHTAAIVDDDGKNVLHTAAEQGSLASCKVIMDVVGSIIINDKDSRDRTPLHLAAEGGHGEVLNYLLEKGADMDKRDNDGATVWDYAKQRQLNYCMLILGSHYRQRCKELEANASQSSLQETRQAMPLKSASFQCISSPIALSQMPRSRSESVGANSSQLFHRTNHLPATQPTNQEPASSQPVSVTEQASKISLPGRTRLVKQFKLESNANESNDTTDAEAVVYEGHSDLQDISRDLVSPIQDMEVDPRPPTTPPPRERRDKSPSNRMIRGMSRESSTDSHQLNQNGFDLKEDDNCDVEEYETQLNVNPIDPLAGLVNVASSDSIHNRSMDPGRSLDNMSVSPTEEPAQTASSRSPPRRHFTRPAVRANSSSPQTRSKPSTTTTTQSSPERPFLRVQPPLTFNRATHNIPTGQTETVDDDPKYQEGDEEVENDPFVPDTAEDEELPSHPPRTPPDLMRRPGYPPQLMPLQHGSQLSASGTQPRKKKKKRRSETAPDSTLLNGNIKIQQPPGYVEPLQPPTSPRSPLNPVSTSPRGPFNTTSSAPAHQLRSRQAVQRVDLVPPSTNDEDATIDAPMVTPRGTSVFLPPPRGFGNGSKESSPRSQTPTEEQQQTTQTIPPRPNGPAVLFPSPGRPRPHHRSVTAGNSSSRAKHWTSTTK